MAPANTDDLSGPALKQAVRGLMRQIAARRATSQNGVPTAFDSSISELMSALAELDPNMTWEDSCGGVPGIRGERLRAGLAAVKAYLRRRSLGRLVGYEERLAITRSELPATVFAMTTGVDECMHWKGMPLFKTVYDMAIYSMLIWQLKPAVIVEIGSGTGASAVWLADLLRLYGIDGHVISFDRRKPQVTADRVTFLQGDCWRIERDFDSALLSGARGPALLLEDAHVNVTAVLRYFHPLLRRGDYLVVEDSVGKREAILEWLRPHPDLYRVDCRYVDFFGQNATCAQDSMFVRVA
jgi:cephalosporin hydroxylase